MNKNSKIISFILISIILNCNYVNSFTYITQNNVSINVYCKYSFYVMTPGCENPTKYEFKIDDPYGCKIVSSNKNFKFYCNDRLCYNNLDILSYLNRFQIIELVYKDFNENFY